jgi:hypothetical protein
MSRAKKWVSRGPNMRCGRSAQVYNTPDASHHGYTSGHTTDIKRKEVVGTGASAIGCEHFAFGERFGGPIWVQIAPGEGQALIPVLDKPVRRRGVQISAAQHKAGRR